MAQTKFLPKKEQENLLIEFCDALLILKNKKEAIDFLVDLLSRKELNTLIKRLKIAKLLVNGKSYKEIESSLKVSHGTISKVSQWLLESGEGFRMVAKRCENSKSNNRKKEPPFSQEWRKVKRIYPAAFWPQILVEEIVKSANRRQKEKIRKALDKIDHKSKTYKNIKNLL